MEQPDPKSRQRALHIALIYAVIAGVWIYAFDQLAAMLTGVAGIAAGLQLSKGWLFVGITSLLLYALLRNVPMAPGEAVAPRKVTVLLPLVLFVLLACAIGVTGYLVFQHHKAGIKAEKHQELAAIANLKARQISEWLSERRADAKVLKDSPYFSDAADAWIRQGAPDGAERDRLTRRLATTWQSYRYAGLALLDAEAQPRLGVGEVGQPGFDEQSMALEAMRLDQVVVGDFHRTEGRTDGAIQLDLYAPLKSSRDGRVVGAVLFRIDPRRFLYPLVQTWPVPSASAESLLVERDGEEVLFLNELRHRPNSAHSLRVPLLDDLPAARAVRGEEGVMEGRDYRGEPVLAALHGVPGTPWRLVAKVDAREVYAPINQLAVVVFALVAVFVAAAGAILWLWWRQRRNAYIAQAYQAELERQAMSKHLEFLTKYANDIILLTDADGWLLECNDRAVEIYGYSREELLAMNARDLRAGRFKEQFEQQWQEVDWDRGVVYEIEQQRRDGSAFPAEVSARTITLDGRRFRQGIIRDISERKAAEEKIARFTNLYAALSQTNHAIIHSRDQQTLFDEVCGIAVARAGFRFAWIGLAEEGDDRVRLVAHHGEDRGYLDTLAISTDPATPAGRGPTGTAIREGRPYLVNDYSSDPNTVPWQAALDERGIRSAGVFPLFREGRCIGALTLYSAQVGFFDQFMVDLLEEMALDISFALDNFSREARRRAAEEKLRLDAKVFEESAEGIMITDAEQRILAVNRTFTEITGYSEAEALGRSPAMLKSDRHDHEFYLNLWASIEQTGRWIGEIWNRRKNGEVFPERLIISAARNEGGDVSHYIGVFTDISSSKEAEQRISHLTHFDALTDLPNQFLLVDHINLALAHARRAGRYIAVLSVNLDRFSNVNERYGHVIGDQVLQAVARRLLDLLREGDTVARIGADHFVIIMPDLGDKQQSTLVASKVLEAIAQPVRVGEVEFDLSARIGIALYPTDGERAEQLMQNADIALARAKSIGGESYIYYTQEQSRELEELLKMESDLRHAVTRKELRLHYQPRLDLLSGEIVSLEALVRWERPGAGLIPPGKFIPVAEHSGAIVPIGEWVLREACRQTREWHEAGFPGLKVSVNVSAVQFHQSNLAALVGEILRETDFPANRLELEVTESLLMQDADETVTILKRIKETGVGFSIDDFGTGYSSLAYLKRFPIDTLKIDRAFISDITFDAADAAIVQGTIALGHSLKLRILAEGVETEAQMGYLRSIHCDEMQGFFYSRPLPPDELLALLRSSRRLQDISSAPATRRKLLLLDDEVNITTALNRVLRRDGYQVLQAHSGREALELLAVHGDVGVVVSDQRMPEMSGTEFLGKVKVLYPDIVRIILSGYTELSTITEAINTGEIYKFITKPWDDEQLRELIRDAFLRFELAKEGKAPGGPESR